MKRKAFEYYSYIAIGIIFILLVLMLARVIPEPFYFYVLGVSIFLLLVRLFFRIYFAVQDKKNSRRMSSN